MYDSGEAGGGVARRTENKFVIWKEKIISYKILKNVLWKPKKKRTIQMRKKLINNFNIHKNRTGVDGQFKPRNRGEIDLMPGK